MACRWRVAASVGWLAAQPVAVGAQVLGQLEAVARVGGGLGRAQRGRAALQLLGRGRDHGVPGGEQSVDHDPAGGLDGHRQVLGSAVAGQSGHSLVDAGLVVGQRPVIHQLAGVVDHGDVVSLAGPVPSDVHVASSRIGQPWFTARCRGPVAACSLFGPWSGISLKAVTGPRPVGGGGPRAGCHPARGIGRPPRSPRSAAHARTGRYQDGGPVSGTQRTVTVASRRWFGRGTPLTGLGRRPKPQGMQGVRPGG